MRQLYDRLDELPDGIRMFLEGPPPELEALRERVACRQMVTRNVLALAAGAGLTVCWDLAPEIPHYRDRLNMLGFLSGTFALLDFDDDGGLTRERPAAATLRMVSRHLAGARGAKPMPTDDPALSAYAIETAHGETLHVLWRDGDLLRGETSPPVGVAWPWPEPTAIIEDPFGARDELATDRGRVTLSTSSHPVAGVAALRDPERHRVRLDHLPRAVLGEARHQAARAHQLTALRLDPFDELDRLRRQSSACRRLPR